MSTPEANFLPKIFRCLSCNFALPDAYTDQRPKKEEDRMCPIWLEDIDDLIFEDCWFPSER